VLFAGSETEWEGADTPLKAVEEALGGYCYWLMAENRYIPASYEGLEVVQQDQETVLLRRPVPVLSLGFS